MLYLDRRQYFKQNSKKCSSFSDRELLAQFQLKKFKFSSVKCGQLNLKRKNKTLNKIKNPFENCWYSPIHLNFRIYTYFNETNELTLSDYVPFLIEKPGNLRTIKQKSYAFVVVDLVCLRI